MKTNPTLSDLFSALHDELLCQLGITRRTVKHAATMGAVSESQWIKMLYKHLPKRYKVNRAFVIDSKGASSKQIDVVIHDRQYSPFVLNYGDAIYVPAESVYAVFEVKQTLDAHNVKYAADKIASVRKLHVTSIPFPWAGPEHLAKDPHHIIGGLLALESEWKPPFGDPLKQAIASTAGAGCLDIGCAANAGVFEAKYADGQAPDIGIEECDAALALFVLRLIERLRGIATVPCMDIAAYAAHLRPKQ